MRLFAITIIPQYRCAVLSILILFKTTMPRAYLLPHWKLLFLMILSVCFYIWYIQTIFCQDHRGISYDSFCVLAITSFEASRNILLVLQVSFFAGKLCSLQFGNAYVWYIYIYIYIYMAHKVQTSWSSHCSPDFFLIFFAIEYRLP